MTVYYTQMMVVFHGINKLHHPVVCGQYILLMKIWDGLPVTQGLSYTQLMEEPHGISKTLQLPSMDFSQYFSLTPQPDGQLEAEVSVFIQLIAAITGHLHLMV